MRPKLSYDRDQLYLKSYRSTQTFSTRRHKPKLQLVAVSFIVSILVTADWLVSISAIFLTTIIRKSFYKIVTKIDVGQRKVLE